MKENGEKEWIVTFNRTIVELKPVRAEALYRMLTRF